MAKREIKTRKKRASKAGSKPKAKYSAARKRNLTRAQEREKAKKEAAKRPILPGSFTLTIEVFKILKKFWRPLLGIVVVYALLNVVLTSGFISGIGSNVSDIKNNLHPNSGQHVNSVSNAVNGFGTLLTGGGNGGTSSLQIVLLVVESLVIIWALRRLLAGDPTSVKQAYYHSMYPLIPFLLVGLVVVVQLLPLTVGTAVLALVLSSAFTNAAAVNFVFAAVFILLAAWTLYMLSTSIFALYIVTLPDMEPRNALRSARNLSRFRRWTIVRRLVFLPIFEVLLIGLVVVPLIIFASFLVAPVFFILVMLAILYTHTYLYNLYRKMIA